MLEVYDIDKFYPKVSFLNLVFGRSGNLRLRNFLSGRNYKD